MRYREIITELFKPGKSWRWEFRGSEEAFASFKIGEIEYLWSASVQNKRDPTQWTLTFRQRGQDSMEKTFGMTGTGNSTEVISTVIDITREFLSQYGDKVLEIKFSSEGESRTSLYAKMVKRMLPDWDMYKRPVGSETDFYLTNPRAYELQGTTENFADGKVKGKSRPGRVKRAGASCAGSVTDLRAKAKQAGGEKGKMYHWCANMKSGRNKK